MDNPYKAPVTEVPIASHATVGLDNESAAKRFRLFLVLSVLIGLGGLPISFIDDAILPAELLNYRNSVTTSELSSAEIAFAVLLIPVVPLLIWNLVQLYRLKASARAWAVGLTLLGIPALFLMGPVAESALSEIWSELSNLSWGIVLAMMYCDPFARQFR